MLMKLEDYNEYYIQGSDHYLIPKAVFIELYEKMANFREEAKELESQLKGTTHCFDEAEHERLEQENQSLRKQLDYLRSGEYFNQLKFEVSMLEHIIENGEVSEEDKKFIDMTHRNTELLEQNQKYKEVINKAIKGLEKGINFCKNDSQEAFGVCNMAILREQSILEILNEEE